MNDERIIGYAIAYGQFWMTSYINSGIKECCYALDTDISLMMTFPTEDEARMAVINSQLTDAKVYEIKASARR